MTRRSRRQSIFGILSAGLAVITCGYSALFHGLSFLMMLMNHPHRVRHVVEDLASPDWFLFIGSVAAIGIILGGVGIVRPRRHRLLPCIGMGINFLVACDVIYQCFNC